MMVEAVNVFLEVLQCGFLFICFCGLDCIQNVGWFELCVIGCVGHIHCGKGLDLNKKN